MSADLTTLIRAKVAERRDSGLYLWEQAMCDLADKILARHKNYDEGNSGACGFCQHTMPCPDVRDLAEAWGIEP